jgi:hypothetical protein
MLAAVVMANLWVPIRAPATLALGLVLPGYLLSYAVFPLGAPGGLRPVVTIVGSLMVSMISGLILAGLFSFTRLGAGVCWAVATVALAGVALARVRRSAPRTAATS